jgi:hypothetical protein
MKRVIITGGTGLIGSALARELAADYEVIVLSRSPGQQRSLPGGVQVVGWDARTTQGWGRLADGAEAIVNLAGYPLDGPGFLPSRWTDARRQIIRQSRLDAGNAVVEAVRQAAVKPRVVIQSSAVGYYGPQGDQPVLESDPPAADYLARLCVEWEDSTRVVEEMGVRRVIIRTGLPLSLEGGAFPLLVLPIRFFLLAGALGSGQQFYPWIHLEDEARAIRFLIEAEQASGAYNISAPEPLPQKELASLIGKTLRRPAFLPIPAFVLRLMFGEVASVVLTGQRAVPERLRAAGFTWKFPTAEAVLRDLLERDRRPATGEAAP